MLRVQKDLPAALRNMDVMILAVPHEQYLVLSPEKIVEWAGKPIGVIDCFGMLTDEVIEQYISLGCEVKAMGRGHIERIKEKVRGK
jgi:hypothetical protein